jgi:hypothetical protein
MTADITEVEIKMPYTIVHHMSRYVGSHNIVDRTDESAAIFRALACILRQVRACSHYPAYSSQAAYQGQHFPCKRKYL